MYHGNRMIYLISRCHYLHSFCRNRLECGFAFEMTICGGLCDLVPFVQFKKCEKHPWRSVNFSEIAG